MDDFNRQLNTVLAAARDGRITGRAESELRDMLNTCAKFKASYPNRIEADVAIALIRDELVRLERKSEQEARDKQHYATILAQNNLHTAVKKLHKGHWTLTPTFAVSLVILIVTVLAWLFPREPLKRNSPISQPAQSNLATLPYISTLPTNAVTPQSASPTSPQTLPVESGATQGTNQAAK